MTEITFEALAAANESELLQLKNALLIRRMKMDKFFTTFLDLYELDENDTSTPEWMTYHVMTERYNTTERLIRAADYHLKKHG